MKVRKPTIKFVCKKYGITRDSFDFQFWFYTEWMDRILYKSIVDIVMACKKGKGKKKK